jgi:3D (Asp-Asp-Asp) domain-containing protein
MNVAMKPKHPLAWLTLCGLLLLLTPVEARQDPVTHRAQVVTATAYNSVPEQTDDDPDVAAWGDRLKPGMKSIAVSRDLLDKGLRRHAKVRIHGLPGEYVVLDKMHHRWENRIDIYMGEDTKAARYFGKRKVRIYWTGV